MLKIIILNIWKIPKGDLHARTKQHAGYDTTGRGDDAVCTWPRSYQNYQCIADIELSTSRWATVLTPTLNVVRGAGPWPESVLLNLCTATGQRWGTGCKEQWCIRIALPPRAVKKDWGAAFDVYRRNCRCKSHKISISSTTTIQEYNFPD